LEVLKKKCIEVNAPYFACREHWDFEVLEDSFNFIDKEEGSICSFPMPSLAGYHQIINASTAIAALMCIEGFDITTQNVIDGIASTSWPARMEQIKSGVLYQMLPTGWELWLDGAHNEAGAQMLSMMAEKWSDKPLFLINGRTGSRDIKAFLQYFYGKVEMVIAVEVESEPLAEKAVNIMTAARELGFESVACDSLREAIVHCIKVGGERTARIVICGSLYLAGDVLLANKG